MFKINELIKATNGRVSGGRRNVIIKGISIDSRTIKAQEAFIAIKGDNFDGHSFISKAIKRGSRVIIVQNQQSIADRKRGISYIVVKDTIKALGNIARYNRQKFNIPHIAVTGSNGKTTIKEMIAWILSRDFKVLKNEGTKNNHIGLPMALAKLDSDYDFAVLELGTNHFGEIQYLAGIAKPNIGVINNIGPSHLEYFGDLEGVYREKCSLLKNLIPPGLAILNTDDSLLKKQVVKKNKDITIFGVGIKNKSDFTASGIKAFNRQVHFLVNAKYRFTLNTMGCFNIYNALFAIAIARLFGMEYKDIADRLASFVFPPNRLNFIELNKIKFIDDTYNSNPLSLNQALEVLDNFKTTGRKIFIMGDMLELGNHAGSFHRQAIQKVARVCDALITVGKLSNLAAQGAAKVLRPNIKDIFSCKEIKEAREILFNKISPAQDDIVLVKGSRAMKMEEIFAIPPALSST